MGVYIHDSGDDPRMLRDYYISVLLVGQWTHFAAFFCEPCTILPGVDLNTVQLDVALRHLI